MNSPVLRFCATIPFQSHEDNLSSALRLQISFIACDDEAKTMHKTAKVNYSGPDP
jgi:hypothetical protein